MNHYNMYHFSIDSDNFPIMKPTKRSYQSQNAQVEKALKLQEKQVAILERIEKQNDSILIELKKLSENQRKQ